MKKLAIATSSGSYKGVFIHGVLSFFEYMNFQAEAYASCSSSALIAALASVNKLNKISISVMKMKVLVINFKKDILKKVIIL